MAKKIPKFSYTGQCSTGSDDTYWYIFLTTSGTLTFEYAKAGVDVGCVGGGGSSACIRQAGNPAGGSGGGGGYLASGKAAIEAKKGYAVTVGAGGAAPAAWAAGNDGETTSALGISAAGGKGAGKMGWKDSGTPGAGTGAGGRGGSEVGASPTEGGDGGYVLGFGRSSARCGRPPPRFPARAWRPSARAHPQSRRPSAARPAARHRAWRAAARSSFCR